MEEFKEPAKKFGRINIKLRPQINDNASDLSADEELKTPNQRPSL